MQHDFILLDRSGSMSNQWSEALNSVNEYVKKLADDNIDTGVTLATFDTPLGSMVFEIVRDRITPITWRKVSRLDAEPRGLTPLNDAVGRLVALAKAGNYDRVAIIIMTDGMENASRELSVGAAKAMLDECRAKGWVVIFLGANFDNAMQAASYGNMASHSHGVAGQSLGQTMRMTASKRADYGLTGSAATMGFSEEEKEATAYKPADGVAGGVGGGRGN